MGLLEALSLAGRVLFRPQEKYHLLFPPQGEGFLGRLGFQVQAECAWLPPAAAHGCQACTPGSQGIPCMLLSFLVWKGAVLFGIEPKPPIPQPTAHSLELSLPAKTSAAVSVSAPISLCVPLAQLPEHAWFS